MKQLNNWYTHYQTPIPVNIDPFNSPEQQKPVVGVSGIVLGHNELPDGSHITTSQVLDVYKENENVFMRTFSGSLYCLGEPNSDYENQCPNSKERLLKTFENKKDQ